MYTQFKTKKAWIFSYLKMFFILGSHIRNPTFRLFKYQIQKFSSLDSTQKHQKNDKSQTYAKRFSFPDTGLFAVEIYDASPLSSQISQKKMPPLAVNTMGTCRINNVRLHYFQPRILKQCKVNRGKTVSHINTHLRCIIYNY